MEECIPGWQAEEEECDALKELEGLPPGTEVVEAHRYRKVTAELARVTEQRDLVERCYRELAEKAEALVVRVGDLVAERDELEKQRDALLAASKSAAAEQTETGMWLAEAREQRASAQAERDALLSKVREYERQLAASLEDVEIEVQQLRSEGLWEQVHLENLRLRASRSRLQGLRELFGLPEPEA